jgi:hypothetical protein
MACVRSFLDSKNPLGLLCEGVFDGYRYTDEVR